MSSSTKITRRTVTAAPPRAITTWVLTDSNPNPFEVAQTFVHADVDWSTPILIHELVKAAAYHTYRSINPYDIANLAIHWDGESFELNGCVFTKGETK